MHMVRYGIHKEARYMSGEFLNTYDVAVVNGNMVAHTPSALARFIGQTAQNKKYLIDPQTHAFQHDLRYLVSGEEDVTVSSEQSSIPIKSSIKKLAQNFGAPITTALEGHRAVEPSDFSDPGLRKEFVSRVLTFQADSLRERDQDNLVKYYEYAGITAALRPFALIAPYFYMDEDTVDYWAPVNQEMLKDSLEIRPYGLPVFAQVVVAQPILFLDSALAKISSYLQDTRPDGIAVWIDDLDETRATETMLRAYMSMLKRLSRIAPVYILYGSYFAVVIMRFMEDTRVVGVCHSLEYGEHRPVVPVGGGFPVSKFYYPKAHARLPFAEAYRLARKYLTDWETYKRNICNCNVCRDVIKNAPNPEIGFQKFGDTLDIAATRKGQHVSISVPSAAARDLAVRHYMFCKQREFEEETTFAEVLRDLKDSYETLSKRAWDVSLIKHLERWARVLESGGSE